MKIAYRAAVNLNKMLHGPIAVAHKIGAGNMYNAVAIAADGQNVGEFLDVFFLVVFPPFMRLQSAAGQAAYHAPSACAAVGVPADYIPLGGREEAP